MEMLCPDCHNPVERTETGAACPHCLHQFIAACPQCHKPLEVLKACGAVDYFCQNGHGLVSKKSVEWVRP